MNKKIIYSGVSLPTCYATKIIVRLEKANWKAKKFTKERKTASAEAGYES